MDTALGQIVEYTPSADHWLDRDINNNLCFEVFDKKHKGRYFGPHQPEKGERWLPAISLEAGKPLYPWPAAITALYSDGSAALEITHPGYVHRLLYSKVPRGDGQLGTWRPSSKRFFPRARTLEGQFPPKGTSPNVSNLSISFSPSISGTVSKSQTGTDYKGPSQTAGLQRSFAFTSANSNTSSLGADEFISYLLNISAGQGAVVSLSSLVDFLLQSGVGLARVKGYRLNLLSVAQDATFGTAASQVTINGPVPPPTQSAVVSSSSGGSIGAGTYHYVITATTAAGESTISNEQSTSALTGTTNSVTLAWTFPTAIQGSITGYKVYRSTTAGTYNSPALITTIGSGATLTYTDTAASTSTGAPPAVNLALAPTTFLLNSTNPYSDRILFNGDYTEWATSAANGLVVGSNIDLYIYNNDGTHAAELQLTFVGGTT